MIAAQMQTWSSNPMIMLVVFKNTGVWQGRRRIVQSVGGKSLRSR